MISANINEIKSKFSYYVNLVVEGEEKVLICYHNNPIAEINSISPTKKQKVRLGVCKDKIVLSKNFNKTSKDIIDSFYK